MAFCSENKGNIVRYGHIHSNSVSCHQNDKTKELLRELIHLPCRRSKKCRFFLEANWFDWKMSALTNNYVGYINSISNTIYSTQYHNTVVELWQEYNQYFCLFVLPFIYLSILNSWQVDTAMTYNSNSFIM